LSLLPFDSILSLTAVNFAVLVELGY